VRWDSGDTPNPARRRALDPLWTGGIGAAEIYTQFRGSDAQDRSQRQPGMPNTPSRRYTALDA